MGKPQTSAAADPASLESAFGVFNELSERLAAAYGQLEARVAALTEELVRSRRDRHDATSRPCQR